MIVKAQLNKSFYIIFLKILGIRVSQNPKLHSMHIVYLKCYSNLMNYNLIRKLKLYLCRKVKHQSHKKSHVFIKL